ncbi:MULTISPECIES: fumarylacetoacetate hydrolase family protein [Streptomyces]|uniref:Fumarylacetoacetate hydrolase family protein n=1 Tax=Streptomyces rhizosphaericus TaxID=114699 RepID=A0A6G4AJH0_9ACTN|nr:MULTISPECIES: fumarylacetoacetate hydrolase family protein [Streptomyces]EXU64144.1 5-oxopent-3-ene-1,2,5-tricarboxylate decarboxylase [Streptomyces sp. PRh5]NEW72647.1 fumarylacetoacetate hydrolase family protein [Streptomyces rhizosphaericus]
MHISLAEFDGRVAITGDDGDGPRVLAEPLAGLSLGEALAQPDLAGTVHTAYRDGTPATGTEFRPLTPVADTAKVFCAGFNYRAAGRERPEHPTLFLRTVASLVGHEHHVVVPAASSFLDWEGEIAVVIGAPARHVSAEHSWRHVAALTCLADNTVRDFAKHGTQATAGKNFEASGAIGPALLLCEGPPAASDVKLTTRLNGEQMQAGCLDDLLHSVEELISYLSDVTTLNPGDVIATGTPPGIGARRQPPRYLRPGDVLEVEVSGVGVLRNPVCDEGAR